LAADTDNVCGEQIRHCFSNFLEEIRDVAREEGKDGVEDVNGSEDDDPLDYLVSGVV
jgi:hypothetical protein